MYQPFDRHVKNIFKSSFLGLILLTILMNSARGELKEIRGSGGRFFEDTATNLIWASGVQTNVNWTEAQNYCLQLDGLYITNWARASLNEHEILLAQITINEPPLFVGEERYHWTNDSTSRGTKAKLIKLNQGVIRIAEADKTFRASHVGIRCMAILPSYNNDGNATPPLLISGKSNITEIKANANFAFLSDWVDKDDPIHEVFARYRKVGATSWLELQQQVIDGHPKASIRYAVDTAATQPGLYEFEFRASSIDGSDIQFSPWISNPSYRINILKDGVTAPTFAGGGVNFGLYSGDLFEFRASWNEADGDPNVINGKLQYRAQGASQWTELTMNQLHNGPQFFVFNKQLILNDSPGNYEVRFKASSADIAGSNISDSQWSAIKTFEIRGITPPVFVQGSTLQNTQTIVFESLWNDPEEDVNSATVRYRTPGNNWVEAAMDLNTSSTSTFEFRKEVNLTGFGNYDYQFKAQSVATNGDTVSSDWSPVQTYELNPRQFRLTVTTTGGNGTIVNSNKIINCGRDCSAFFNEGSDVTLSAIPGNGYSFNSWVGCTSVTSGQQCRVKIEFDKTVTATFSTTPASIPTKPVINSPATATVDQTFNINITRGTDSVGQQVKVQCTATNSNFTNSSPFVSSLASGGTPATANIQFSSIGVKTISCQSINTSGTSSSSASKAISIIAQNSPPSAPKISLSPTSASINQTFIVEVTSGADSNGDNVKVQCTATDSNFTNANPYISTFGAGGIVYRPNFKFLSAGTKTLFCTSFDQSGAASPVTNRTISIIEALEDYSFDLQITPVQGGKDTDFSLNCVAPCNEQINTNQQLIFTAPKP